MWSQRSLKKLRQTLRQIELIKKFIHINLIYYKSNKGTVNTDLPDTLNLNFQATRVLKRNEF